MTRTTAFAFAAIVSLAASREADATTIDEPASGTESAERQRQQDQPTPWGAIVAGCLGVAFGGLIAAWQIKGLSKRR